MRVQSLITAGVAGIAGALVVAMGGAGLSRLAAHAPTLPSSAPASSVGSLPTWVIQCGDYDMVIVVHDTALASEAKELISSSLPQGCGEPERR